MRPKKNVTSGLTVCQAADLAVGTACFHPIGADTIATDSLAPQSVVQVLSLPVAWQGRNMFSSLIGLVVIWFFLTSTAIAQSPSIDKFIRYDDLNQKITLQKLRAGNHDPSGINEYFFKVTIHAIAILKEERKKELKDRKKITRDLGEFASVTLKSLSVWNPEEDPKSPLEIEGDLIRELAADAMRQFALSEDQISILVHVVMLEKNKQFMFLGEDQTIGMVDYFIIPETLPHRPDISTKTLTISDQQGLFAELSITYDKLSKQQARK